MPVANTLAVKNIAIKNNNILFIMFLIQHSPVLSHHPAQAGNYSATLEIKFNKETARKRRLEVKNNSQLNCAPIGYSAALQP
jgi:hypothetical protein